MVELPRLRVIQHAEGAVNDPKVYVHGAPVEFKDNEGVADPVSNPSFVRFEFSGNPGARFRVEIRNGAAIVYREEVQLPTSGGYYDSKNRDFTV